jgi:hypothetical protein
VGSASPALAQNTSTTQMQLVNSPVFTTRLQYLGVQVMKEVLEEAQSAAANGAIPAYTAACHTKRTAFATSFLYNPAGSASNTSVLVSGANFSGAVIVGTVIGSGATADSSATDGAIQQAYRILMNTFAGCVVNP